MVAYETSSEITSSEGSAEIGRVTSPKTRVAWERTPRRVSDHVPFSIGKETLVIQTQSAWKHETQAAVTVASPVMVSLTTKRDQQNNNAHPAAVQPSSLQEKE